ncbi:MAG: DEAD/DEAH box helicase [Candidatus Methanoperedens sp.]|nr:DEAD/DEAH box helicase [Candidatus Methanoperedens sp.]
MVGIYSQEKFADEILNYIISRVTGTHSEDEVIDEKPGKSFLIGTLAARKERVEEDVKLDDEGKAASIRAPRLKVSILTARHEIESNPDIIIKATGNVYYQIKNYSESEITSLQSDEEPESQKEKYHQWKRLGFSHTFKLNILHNPELYVDFSQVQERANKDPLIFKQIPDNLWKAKIYVKITDFNEKDLLISFNYENESLEQNQHNNESDEQDLSKQKDKKFDGFERTLFNCKLEIDLGGLHIKEFCDEYLYENYKQRYYYDFRTVNCQAEWIEPQRKFVTEHFGRFKQNNILPKEKISNLNLTFSNLTLPDSAIFSLDGFVNEMKEYLELYNNNIPANIKEDGFQPRVEDREITWKERRELIQHFADLIHHVENGLYLIKTNENVKEAFLKTNESFANYYLSQGIKNAGWRLFQIAFFLSSIESVVEKKDLDVVNVLHVDTGGGKSEAYFALVVFASFYERMTGKKEGVSAIVKFPLRMLSIQQLERVSGIIIHAEAVRKKYSDMFLGSPFSLGYYVGSDDDFPDIYIKVKKTLYDENNLLKSPAQGSKIISKCPLCPPDFKGNIHLIDDEKGKRIIHKCDKCGGEYYIYQSDREVFRWRPTVVVSTVDKWAGLSQQRRARSLLGGSGSMCPEGHGFIPSGDKCEDKAEEDFKCENIGENNKNYTGPILSIQDEMHLLREGFGTISAHFEGLIETIVEDTSNHKLKHIAMSATLNGTEKQIYELYNKKYFVIPGRCPEGAGSPNDFFFEKKEGTKRVICGLKPNLRDNHYASLRTLLHFAEFIIKAQKELNSDSDNFCKKYNLTDSSEAQELIKQYLIPLTYHVKKQDAYDMGRLKETVVGDRLKTHFNGSDVKGEVLTGDSNLDDLKKAIDNVSEFIKNYDPINVDNTGLIFEPIYATSVVSHGVDLNELNFMIFQGLPYSTSEYIQALSRVGRKNLGIVLLWFYPNRVRDDSFYRNFDRYHNSLDHEVRPIPINRSSRLGLQQTINSMFCAGIINYLSNKKGKPCYLKSHVDELTQKDKDELVEFIQKTYGKSGLDLDINLEIQDRINLITQGNDGQKEFFPKILTKSGKSFYRNLTGMRGIQKQLVLEVKPEDERKLKQKEN